MFTASLKSKTLDRPRRRIVVTVTLTDGITAFDETFYFSMNTTVEQMKKTVQSYLDELNGADDKVAGLTDLTLTPEAEPEAPTQVELAKQAWQADRAKLATVMELVRDGVFDGTEAQVTALQNKVRTGFKPAYLD